MHNGRKPFRYCLLGYNEFIKKPFNAIEQVECIRKCLAADLSFVRIPELLYNVVFLEFSGSELL
jgi:hypothetical protein